MEFVLDKNILIIKMDKEIDQHGAEPLQRKVDELIEKNPVKVLIFDFSETSFMDSSAIGIVMGRYKLMREVGGDVGIMHVSSYLKKIFRLSGLFQIVNEYDSLEDAIKNLR